MSSNYHGEVGAEVQYQLVHLVMRKLRQVTTLFGNVVCTVGPVRRDRRQIGLVSPRWSAMPSPRLIQFMIVVFTVRSPRRRYV